MSRRQRRTSQEPTGATIEIGMWPVVIGLLAVVAVAAVVMLRPVRPAPDASAGSAAGPTGGGAALPTSPAPGAAFTPEPGTWLTAAGDPAIGSPSAPVAIVEYTDFQCPNCRQFAAEVLPWLRDGWISRGFVQVSVRDFAVRGEESYLAAQAAWCAGEQGRYWSYHDQLFEVQSGENAGTFARDTLVRIAADLGLDAEALGACVDSGRYRARIQASSAAAQALGYEGTPTYEINGRHVQGAIPVESWEELFVAFSEDIARATAGAATVTP